MSLKSATDHSEKPAGNGDLFQAAGPCSKLYLCVTTISTIITKLFACISGEAADWKENAYDFLPGQCESQQIRRNFRDISDVDTPGGRNVQSGEKARLREIPPHNVTAIDGIFFSRLWGLLVLARAENALLLVALSLVSVFVVSKMGMVAGSFYLALVNEDLQVGSHPLQLRCVRISHMPMAGLPRTTIGFGCIWPFFLCLTSLDCIARRFASLTNRFFSDVSSSCSTAGSFPLTHTSNCSA